MLINLIIFLVINYMLSNIMIMVICIIIYIDYILLLITFNHLGFKN